jgi:hypothetical protein
MNQRHHIESLIVVAVAAYAATHFSRKHSKGSRRGKQTRHRERRTVEQIYQCLGDIYFRRAYRMSWRSFWILHDKLCGPIEEAVVEAAKIRKEARRKEKRKRGVGISNRLNPTPPPPPNGTISTSVRLACALRYYAGGSVYDIMSSYGISHTEVFESVWYVVDAVNASFNINYPRNHDEQKKIAAEFKAVSAVEFDVCAGAIDGILIWILKPPLEDAEAVGVDQMKFMCGRKHKYGLNCQAVCDVRGRFLDMSIICGGASSDLVAFEGSDLKKLLDDGILAHNLCLFGDNAYINSQYMVTPYPNTSGGARDNYNYFHSQLRIRIECAFGMFVQRWGMLRTAIPCNVSVPKTISLVLALAKLHNFCIDEAEVIPANLLSQDEQNITGNRNGSVPLVADPLIAEIINVNTTTPRDLMGGGEHFDDAPRHYRRPLHNDALRSRLCNHVESTFKTRPRRREP